MPRQAPRIDASLRAILAAAQSLIFSVLYPFPFSKLIVGPASDSSAPECLARPLRCSTNFAFSLSPAITPCERPAVGKSFRIKLKGYWLKTRFAKCQLESLWRRSETVLPNGTTSAWKSHRNSSFRSYAETTRKVVVTSEALFWNGSHSHGEEPATPQPLILC